MQVVLDGVADGARDGIHSSVRRRNAAIARRRLVAVLSLWLAAIGNFRFLTADEPAAKKPEQVAADAKVAAQVQSLLRTRCLACHGDDPRDLKGKLDLRSRAAMLRGGESGEPAIVPGRPNASPIMAAVERRDPATAMPPKENDRLSAADVALIRQWIVAGAAWPENHAAKTPSDAVEPRQGVVVRTTAGRSPDWNEREYKRDDVWAFLPVVATPPPRVRASGADVEHPIDAFLLQRLQASGRAGFAPRVAAKDLVRRAYLDLLGLPPTFAEAQAFQEDTARAAWPNLVDRLLASEHYGEQMARHWLDVARYADTSGFSNDFERPNAWRYRDYVVRSFNADKRFDRFIREQIAGDELEPENPELAIAAGFLRLGPWEHTGMSVAALTRQMFLDDVVNHIGVVFLGQPLRCAACHDHKFDPIPTKDYYRLQAVFAPTHFTERPLPFLASENTRHCDEAHARTQQRIQETDAAKAVIKRRSDDALAAYLKEKNVQRIEDLPVNERPKKDYLGVKLGLTEQDLTLRKVYQKRIDYLNRELRRYQPWVFTVYSGPANTYLSNNLNNPVPNLREINVSPIHVLIGGSLTTPAEAVTPGVLSAVFGSNDDVAPSDWNSLPKNATGRRIGLAHWIASPQNTLTARVMVNRVWQWHFGRGLVETSNNFGKMGGRPSHPELLDWLADWFVKNDWSLKRLHRLIMTSAAYQQATELADNQQLASPVADDKNLLLARFHPRRLAAEELRDSLLATTGELNREAGGPAIFPEIAWEDALQPRHIMGSVAPAYQPSRTPAERNRRTLYAIKIRTLPDPLLATFNKPGSDLSCDRRDETTVAPQALALFNSDFTQDRATALAAKIAREHATAADRVAAAFRQLYLRDPGVEERRWCVEHLQSRVADHVRRPVPPVPLPRAVKRRMVEELTGQEIEWEEELDLLRDYVPDLKPWQVSAEVRALADLCLVLMNSNEFVYVR